MSNVAAGSSLRRVLGSVLLALALGACSHAATEREEPIQEGAADEESVAADPSEELCKADGMRCIEVAPMRTALIYENRDPQGSEPRDLVVWNPGGPGLTPPPASVLSIAFPAALRPYDVVYFVEPWVLDPPTERCLNEGEQDESACETDTLTWSATEMESALAEAERTTGGSVVGLYGTSFGATVNGSLMPDVLSRGGWAILENPAPPSGTPLNAILTSRADAIVRLIAGWNDCEIEAPCYVRRSREVRGWGEAGAGDLDPGSSALGLAALTTDPGSNVAFLNQLVHRLDRGMGPSATQQRALRRAAERFSLRGSVPGSVQPSLVGLWAGTCAAYGGVSAGSSGLAAGLAAIYRGCHERRPGGEPETLTSSRVLLVHGQEDAVVAPEIQRRWNAYAPRASSVDLTASGHFRDDGRVNRAIASWLDGLDQPK